MEGNPMDINTYNRVSEPKTIDTINLGGKYINSSDLKSKVLTISAVSAFILAFGTFIGLLLF
jgi:hypothetical protein